MVNYMYKIGDLVWLKNKHTCGTILSWRVDNNDLLEYEVEYNNDKIKWFAEYEIEHQRCEQNENQH